jgi:tellurite resistance protein TehA-like permease
MDTIPLTFRLNQWGKKIAAIAFIVLILVGNVWLIYRFTGDLFPQWSIVLFASAVVAAFIGGLLMIPELIWPSEITDEKQDGLKKDKSES